MMSLGSLFVLWILLVSLVSCVLINFMYFNARGLVCLKRYFADRTTQNHQVTCSFLQATIVISNTEESSLIEEMLVTNGSCSLDKRKLIIVLERANLDIVKIDGQYKQPTSYKLLNCDDYLYMIRKLKKDPAFCRPDIVYQCLQILSQCPLNRAGLLQVYVRTQNNELFRVDPQLKVPDTFEGFTEIMVQLLHNLRPVRAKKGSKQLLKLLKNPVTLHLPVGCPKYGTSSKAKRVIRPTELVPPQDSADNSVVVVIGAMAHESCEPDYVTETVSISRCPLSAALVCAKITGAFEEAWNVH